MTVEPLFVSGPVWIVVPDAPGSEATRKLLELESGELEAELGAPVVLVGDPPSGANALVLEVDADEPTARLVRDGSRLRARGSSLEVCELALSLLRTMRRRATDSVTWSPADTLESAIRRVDAEVVTTWPSFRRTGLEWGEVRSASGSVTEVADLQRLVARLGDGHTNVHPRTDLAALPYSAKVIDGALVMVDVPEDTLAWQAGVRPGDEIVDVDIDDITAGVGATPHLAPWVIGRRVLGGPVGQPRRLRTRSRGGTSVSWEDVPGRSTWPQPVEFRRLRTGTAYLRIRRWSGHDAVAIDRALGDLAVGDRLLVDLRGNAGGSLVEAVGFRRRLIDEPSRTGSVRYSRGDGTLTAPTYYDDVPSDRTRWTGRTRFLIDALTYSASEDAILGLDQHAWLDVVGQPSGGGSGRARRVPILGTSVLTVSTALTYDHLGHCIEGDGVGVAHRLDDDRLTPDDADLDW